MDYALRAPRQSPRKIEFPSFTASGESCTTRNCHRDAARSESETNNWKMRKKIRSDVDYMSTMTISSVSNVESSNSIRDWKFTQSSEIRSIVSRRLMELWNNSNFSSSKLTQSSFNLKSFFKFNEKCFLKKLRLLHCLLLRSRQTAHVDWSNKRLFATSQNPFIAAVFIAPKSFVDSTRCFFWWIVQSLKLIFAKSLVNATWTRRLKSSSCGASRWYDDHSQKRSIDGIWWSCKTATWLPQTRATKICIWS